MPPWQLVSAQLDGLPLRVASWWCQPKIYSTTADTPLGCWHEGLGTPGPVDIATTGTWNDRPIGFEGEPGPDGNHAKLGVSTDERRPLSIFGDMNQQGALCKGYNDPDQPCSSSQNGRGGLFYVLDHAEFHGQLSALLAGQSAPTEAP